MTVEQLKQVQANALAMQPPEVRGGDDKSRQWLLIAVLAEIALVLGAINSNMPIEEP